MDHPEKTDYRAFYEVIYPVEQPKKPFYGFQKKRKHHIFFNQRGENSVTTKGEFLITIDIVSFLLLDLRCGEICMARQSLYRT